MNIYLISQTENNNYDSYDSAVVCAKDENEARNMSPIDGTQFDWNDNMWLSWACKPENITVKLIGKANKDIKHGVICSSYNAG